MAPSKKNSNTDLINPANWNSRVPGVADSEADFFNKSNCSFQGWVFNSNHYNDLDGARTTVTGNAYPATIFKVGPFNEITFQKTGTPTLTFEGSINGKDYVTCNTTTSADGLIRINSLYRFLRITGSSVGATDALYMQVW